MKNEDLLIHIDGKFDEVHSRINKLDKSMSKIWSNTIFQYLLLFLCVLCFVIYEYKIENLNNRVDILFSKINSDIIISNDSSSSNTNKTYKTKNSVSNSHSTSLFGR